MGLFVFFFQKPYLYIWVNEWAFVFFYHFVCFLFVCLCFFTNFFYRITVRHSAFLFTNTIRTKLIFKSDYLNGLFWMYIIYISNTHAKYSWNLFFFMLVWLFVWFVLWKCPPFSGELLYRWTLVPYVVCTEMCNVNGFYSKSYREFSTVILKLLWKYPFLAVQAPNFEVNIMIPKFQENWYKIWFLRH